MQRRTQLDSKGAPFAGAASRVIQTDGAGALSTSSVTAVQLSYLDATSSIQDQFDNAGGGGFSGTSNRVMCTDSSGDASAYDNFRLENSGHRLKMTGTQNQELKIEHSVYGETLTLHSSYGAGGIRYAGCKVEFHRESGANGRIQLQGDLLRCPRNASNPPQNSANSSGGIFYNTTTDRLMAHTAGGWKEIATV